MNILVTGSGRSGSWKIRGEQLGRAIGATVVPCALDVAAFDVAVVVKRPPRDTVLRIHQAGIPLAWDVVDAWPQPEGNDWSRQECMAWLHGTVKWMRPAAIVAATQQMARDCRELGVPVLAVPHHARPGLGRTEIRPLRVVGYEGGVSHLGAWRDWLDAECARRGWRFVMNPGSINDLDVAVALRERTGYGPRNWKSNVKLANAQASGTPIICAPEAGYLETSPCGGAIMAETEAAVRAAFERLEPVDVRREIADRLVADAPHLRLVAADYRRWLLETVCIRAPSF